MLPFLATFGLCLLLNTLLTLVHELGHAVPVLATTSQPVVIRVGLESSGRLFGVRLGRKTSSVTRPSFYGGFCRWPARLAAGADAGSRGPAGSSD